MIDKELSATRNALHNAKGRCHNPNHAHYRNYGARGIEVHPMYLEPVTGVEAFIAEVGIRPSPKHTLDRIDVNKGYEPGNMRWATRKEQGLNRRPFKVQIRDLGWGFENHDRSNGKTFPCAVIEDQYGRRQTVAAWSIELGISSTTLIQRVDRRWPIQDVLANKLFKPGPHYKNK